MSVVQNRTGVRNHPTIPRETLIQTVAKCLLEGHSVDLQLLIGGSAQAIFHGPRSSGWPLPFFQ